MCALFKSNSHETEQCSAVYFVFVTNPSGSPKDGRNRRGVGSAFRPALPPPALAPRPRSVRRLGVSRPNPRVLGFGGPGHDGRERARDGPRARPSPPHPRVRASEPKPPPTIPPIGCHHKRRRSGYHCHRHHLSIFCFRVSFAVFLGAHRWNRRLRVGARVGQWKWWRSLGQGHQKKKR